MSNVAKTLKEYIQDADMATGSIIPEEEQEEKYAREVENQLVTLRYEAKALRSKLKLRHDERKPVCDIDEQKDYLQQQIDKLPKSADSPLLSHLITVEELETVIDNLRHALESCNHEKAHLITLRDYESDLQTTLVDYNFQLRKNTDMLDSHINNKNEGVNLVLRDMQEKLESSKKLNKKFLGDLRLVLDNVVCEKIKDDITSITSDDDIAVQLRTTIETLLNAMFEDDDFYIELNPNDQITKFLVDGGLIFSSPQNTSMFRLRDFGKT